MKVNPIYQFLIQKKYPERFIGFDMNNNNKVDVPLLGFLGLDVSLISKDGKQDVRLHVRDFKSFFSEPIRKQFHRWAVDDCLTDGEYRPLDWENPFEQLSQLIKANPKKDDILGFPLPEDLRDSLSVATLPSSPNQMGISISQIKDRVNPHLIQPGISIGHKNNQAGTLGSIVFRRENSKDQDQGQEILALSAWHVLARAANSDTEKVIGDPRTLQPGFPDPSTNPYRNYIGNLGSNQKPEKFLDRGITWGDGAYAILREPFFLEGGGRRWRHGAKPETLGNLGRKVRRGQLGTESDQDKGVLVIDPCCCNCPWRLISDREEREEIILCKSGKATGVTCGKLDGVGIYVLVLEDIGAIVFPGFMLVPLQGFTSQELSLPGDSGAIWFLREQAPEASSNGDEEEAGLLRKRRNKKRKSYTTRIGMGIHVDGEKAGVDREYALACFLRPVLDELDITLDQESCDKCNKNDKRSKPEKPCMGCPESCGCFGTEKVEAKNKTVKTKGHQEN